MNVYFTHRCIGYDYDADGKAFLYIPRSPRSDKTNMIYFMSVWKLYKGRFKTLNEFIRMAWPMFCINPPTNEVLKEEPSKHGRLLVYDAYLRP